MASNLHYHYENEQDAYRKQRRAPSLPADHNIYAQPSSRPTHTSTSSLAHQQHPAGPSTSTNHHHQAKNYNQHQHDSGYHASYDGAEEERVPSNAHLSQFTSSSQSYSNPSPHQSYDSLSYRNDPTPATKFEDIPATFSNLNTSPHSSVSSHAKTPSLSRFLPSRLRTSSSAAAVERPSMDRDTPPRSEYGSTQSSSFRSSDQSAPNFANGAPTPKAMKKRSGFSSFMQGLTGSKSGKMEISAPSNPTHLCHVGFNNQTGEFTVSNSCAFCFHHSSWLSEEYLTNSYNSILMSTPRVFLNHGRRPY